MQYETFFFGVVFTTFILNLFKISVFDSLCIFLQKFLRTKSCITLGTKHQKL